MKRKSLIRRALPWAATGLGGAIALANLSIAFFVEQRLVRPRRKYNHTSDLDNFVPDVPYSLESHLFESYDGCKLSAILLKPDIPNGKIILVCHGVRHDKRSGVRFVQYLLKAGYTLMLMDFRNHGESGGRITTYGYHEKEDLRSAIRYLRNQGLNGSIGVLGASMGASVALQAAADFDDIQAMVLDSPFASLEQIALEQTILATKLPKFAVYFPVWLACSWARFVERFPVCEVSPAKSARDLKCPIFLIHGDADRKIGSHHSEHIYENAFVPKELWICEGAGHLGTYLKFPKEYETRVLKFFNAHLI
jgi:dipeptidyl aminopeptidase/acylaminoacyl peptidase